MGNSGKKEFQVSIPSYSLSSSVKYPLHMYCIFGNVVDMWLNALIKLTGQATNRTSGAMFKSMSNLDRKHLPRWSKFFSVNDINPSVVEMYVTFVTLNSNVNKHKTPKLLGT